MDDEKGAEIDTELLLQYLLAFSGDEELRQQVVERISKNTGLPPEQVEITLKAVLEVLMNHNPRLN